jgi:hypothetical protein
MDVVRPKPLGLAVRFERLMITPLLSGSVAAAMFEAFMPENGVTTINRALGAIVRKLVNAVFTSVVAPPFSPCRQTT